MKTIIVIFLSSLLATSSLANQNNDLPFTSPQSPFQPEISRITYFNCTIQSERVFLNWTVETNEDTNQFEVERSIDGKNFVMAALVFGTDKADTDNYKFFEKVKAAKIYYRIKILHKDQTITYSDTVMAKAVK